MPTTFPEHPDPEQTDPAEFRTYVLKWLGAFNDWHHTVDVQLATVEERTKHMDWVRWMQLGTLIIAAVGLILRVTSGAG